MTRDQYVDSIKMMMDNQDRYFMWFLGVLGVVLVFVGILQWRLSNNQIKKITIDAKDEARKEIVKELVDNYGINNVTYLIEKSKEYTNEIEKISNSVSILESEKKYEEKFGILKEVRGAIIGDVDDLCYELYLIYGSHIRYLLKNKENFDQFIELIGKPSVLSKLEKSESTTGFTEFISVLEQHEDLFRSDELMELIDKIKKIYENKTRNEKA